MTSTEQRLTRLERRHAVLTICVAAFVALHALIIPLLPRLFHHAPCVAVAALIVGIVGIVALALTATRARP